MPTAVGEHPAGGSEQDRSRAVNLGAPLLRRSTPSSTRISRSLVLSSAHGRTSRRQGHYRWARLRAERSTWPLRTGGRGAREPAAGGRVRRPGLGDLISNWWRRLEPAVDCPDATAPFQAELLGSADQGDTGWAEWHWHSTRTDGTRLDMRGVTIFGVREDRIDWGRLYLEDVEGGRGSTRPCSTWHAEPSSPPRLRSGSHMTSAV